MLVPDQRHNVTKYVYSIIQTLFSLQSCSVYIIKHTYKDNEPSVTLSAESNKNCFIALLK